jgi:hypothetical protein
LPLFPLSDAGEVRFAAGPFDLSSIVEALADALRQHRPSVLTTTTDAISFKAGFLRPVLNTNLLVPITRGRIKVAHEDSMLVIRYELKFTELVVLGTLLVAWISFAISRTKGALTAVAAFALMWAFLVGGNWALSRSRFRSLITRSVGQLSSLEGRP